MAEIMLVVLALRLESQALLIGYPTVRGIAHLFAVRCKNHNWLPKKLPQMNPGTIQIFFDYCYYFTHGQ